MASTTERLLTLLSLLQARRDWPGPLLAERLNVSDRTVRRDVEKLRAMGYPVQTSKGPDGGYRLRAGSSLPPLLFDDDQALAVTLALQTVTTSVTGLDDGAQRALATIRQVLPQRLRIRVDALEVIDATPTGRVEVDPQELVAIGTAVRRREILRFDYARPSDDPDAAGGEASRGVPTPNTPAPAGVVDGEPAPGRPAPPPPPRRVEPHHVALWRNRWYLVAWDLDREAWRTFRVDRMTTRSPTGPRFSPRTLPGEDVATYLERQFGRGDWPCRGQVLMQLPARTVARYARGDTVIDPQGEDACVVTAAAWSWNGLAAWFGLFGAPFQVLGPAELASAARTLSQRYAEAAFPAGWDAGATDRVPDGREDAAER